MKETEMKTIGGWISRVIHNAADEKVIAEVKAQVEELCKGFLIYEDYMD